VRRRQFMALLGGAAVWPTAARAQQPPIPVVGILNSGGTNPYAVMNKALVRGITEAGFAEGRHFVVEERFGNGQFERLPELAAELVRMRISLLAVPAGDTAARVAKQATSTIPVVFIVGGDPVQSGLIARLCWRARSPN
jgi:putative ABC transport system substrate-binding protein